MTEGTRYRRKRCKRYDIEGHAHYLTFSCFQRKSFLSRDRTCLWVLDAIDKARTKEPFDLWAYVIMPEHVHLLILPHAKSRMSRILSAIKQPVAKKALIWTKREAPDFLGEMADTQPNGKVSHRFWQRGGGYDRNIWTAEELHEKLRYIHVNPVRRGLAAIPDDWRRSSWAAWQDGTDSPIRIDRGSFPVLERH